MNLGPYDQPNSDCCAIPLREMNRLACYMAVVVAGYAFYRVVFPLLMEFETLNE